MSRDIGGTAYFNINSSYYDFDPGGEKDPVVNRINYGGSVYDNYSRGATLTDNDIGLIMENTVFSEKLPNGRMVKKIHRSPLRAFIIFVPS